MRERRGKERLSEMLNAIQTHLCLRTSSFIPFVYIHHIDFVSYLYNVHTCTMIPFELYSLRRTSEKWLSNLCKREDDQFPSLVLTAKI